MCVLLLTQRIFTWWKAFPDGINLRFGHIVPFRILDEDD